MKYSQLESLSWHLLDADARLFTGSYDVSQQWSQTLQNHPQNPDGIYYRSRHDPSRSCLALYKLKTSSILQAINSYEFTSDDYVSQLALILDEYQYGLI